MVKVAYTKQSVILFCVKSARVAIGCLIIHMRSHKNRGIKMYRSPEWECECGSVAYPEMVVDGAVVYRCVLCTKNFVIMDSEQPTESE